MGERHLISTPARVTSCPSCHGLVLAGIDQGLVVRVDPQPLSSFGELWARVAGRWTYDLGPRRELWLRTVHTIKVHRHLVLADHVCGAGIPPPSHRGPGPPPIIRSSDSDTPPF